MLGLCCLATGANELGKVAGSCSHLSVRVGGRRGTAKKRIKKRKVYNLKFSSEKKSRVHVLAYKRLDREQDVMPVPNKPYGFCGR